MTGKSIIHVHHRGDRGVDGIMRLIELASHDGPIEMMLTAMCDEVCAITEVEVASIYVVEDDRLVMRGNHGFAPTAIGTTALAVGEGLTGLVAECMRPVSAAQAQTERAYKHVPGLGEEHFPVYAGVPLISGGAVIGVLVMQRRKKPFAADEVTLATALGAPFTLAVERRRASAVRSARLVGDGHGGAVVLGRAGLVPTTTAVADSLHNAALNADASAGTVAQRLTTELDRVLGRLRDDLGRALKKLANHDDVHVGAVLDRFSLALLDQRLRERILANAAEASGLRAVAKDYARASAKLGNVDDERVGEIEELCALIGMTADPRPSARPGAVWIADRIGAVMMMIAVARGAAAVITSDTASPAAIAVARAGKLPLVTGVSGLFGWVRPGDLLAVEAESGTVLVHPAPTEIERLRRERTD
jgi:phosphotransferase system enzyme I (PtsP)